MIKHMPSGLFPHFDSALERRPYFAQTGDLVSFGCRLDGEEKEPVHLAIKDKKGERLIAGEYHSTNDRGQRYYRFFYPIGETESSFVYRFITDDGTESKEYRCPVLREQTLYPEIEKKNDKICLNYYTDTRMYCWEIFTVPCIRIILTSNLIVKTDRPAELYEKNREPLCLYKKDGSLLMKLDPALTIMTDECETPYNIFFRASFSGNAVFGLGEKFDAVNQLGKSPLNYVVEQFSSQNEKTYMPIPFMFTDGGVSFLQRTSYPSSFNLEKADDGEYVNLECFAVCAKERVLYEADIHVGSPAELLQFYMKDTGKAIVPPKWAFGPWMSSNGWNTQREALEQISRMHETGIPATVMVLEAWSDEETFYIWNDAKYTPREAGGDVKYSDFEFPPDGKWPNPKAFCETLSRNNIKLILWQIPVIKYEQAPHGKQLDFDTAYAQKNGLCLKNEDGTPYRITEMWFGNSLIPDFTNPKTKEWWFDCRRYLLEELGVAGFKTDGGEFLFDPDAYFHDGRRVAQAHNEFPNIYEGAYHELLKPYGGITFSRAGYTGAQRYPLHWAGDQLSTFAELRGQLTAGLSAGLSGIPFWGFDIGGFAGDFPSTELYLRSAALAAFAPVMQFHSEPRGGQYYLSERKHWNNDRSPWNMAAVNQDETIISIYRLFANLRMNLLPYIWKEAECSGKTGRPLMAHLIYDYPHDRQVCRIEDQYMFGRDLMIAPIIAEGVDEREVYLPEGIWFDWWSGERIRGGHMWNMRCPLDKIPIYVRDKVAIPVNLNDAYCMGTQSMDGIMSADVTSYENLCFLLYGNEGMTHFTDDTGNDFSLCWTENNETVEGTLSCPITIFRMTGISHGNQTGNLLGRSIKGNRRERT